MLRVLCFHGYGQNASIFRNKIGGFRKYLKNHCEFDFIQAPFKIKASDTHGDDAKQESEEIVQGTWWDFSKNSQGDYVYEGCSEAMKYVSAYIAANGPYDGYVGFSQGAAFVSLMVAIQHQKTLDSRMWRESEFVNTFSVDVSPKFVMLCGGFVPRCVRLKPFFFESESKHRTQFDTPALHIMGETDQMVSFERQMELHDQFANPSVYQHKGGHFLPATADSRDAYVAFLQKLATE